MKSVTKTHDGTGISRRGMLKGLSSGFGYLAFAGLAHEAAARGNGLLPRTTHFPARAKRVIFLCMKGGPSHVDLFDFKPELNARSGDVVDIERGPKGVKLLGSAFDFSRHGESGLPISDVMPELSAHADDLCLVNGMHTDLPNHPQAFAQMHTGSFQFVRPSLGAWSLYGLGTANENLPGFITLNPPADFGGARNYGSSFLPAICQGTKIGGGQLPGLFAAITGKDEEPGPPMKYVDNEKFSRGMQRSQLDLIRGMNEKKLATAGYHPEIEGAIESFELAFRMQDEVPEVLDLGKEPAHIRKLYGIGEGEGNERFARQCLLARRLAEAGVRFVEVTAPMTWDHHRMLKGSLEENAAATDRAVGALLADLKQRGMFEDTLVIWAGEFGRTPYAQSGDGRDHNNKGYSLWMAGGGVKGGIRYGETDEFGYRAVVNPVHIHDWHATILHLLGLDHRRLTYSYAGREYRLTDVYGEVVKGVIG
ncbi:MAG: DUF1501 domain-containing protein [Verrucomicrobiota bacterium]